MIEDRTGIGGLIKEKIVRLRRLIVHKLSAKEISVGTIKEKVSGSGVTIGGLLLKDGEVDGVDVSAHAADTTSVHGITDTSKLVTSNANIDDHTLVRGDLGGLGVQKTGITVDDSDNVTVPGNVTIWNLILVDDKAIILGTGMDYLMAYVSADTRWILWSNDIDGGGGDGIVMKVEDGTDDVDFSGDINVGGTVNGVDIAARDHTQAHGIAAHTEHGNWKLLSTDGSGDEQELALTAAGSQTAGYQYLRSTSATGAPELKEVMRAVSITIEDPEANDDIPIHFFFQAVTIREIEVVIVGTSCTIDPYHNTDRSAGGGATDVLNAATAITATTSYNIPGDGGTLNDVTIPADSWLIMEVTAETACTEIAVTFRYTIDA